MSKGDKVGTYKLMTLGKKTKPMSNKERKQAIFGLIGLMIFFTFFVIISAILFGG